MSRLSKSIAELKHSVQVFMIVTGGPTPQLGQFMLKLIDVLDEIEDEEMEKAVHDIKHLAYHLMDVAASGIYDRVAIVGEEHHAKISFLATADANMTKARYAQDRTTMFGIVISGLEALHKLTGLEYPTLPGWPS